MLGTAEDAVVVELTVVEGMLDVMEGLVVVAEDEVPVKDALDVVELIVLPVPMQMPRYEFSWRLAKRPASQSEPSQGFQLFSSETVIL